MNAIWQGLNPAHLFRESTVESKGAWMPHFLSSTQALEPPLVLLQVAFAIAGLGLLLWLMHSLLQHSIVPWIIQKTVKEIPLDKDLKFNELSVLSFHRDGHVAKLDLTVLHTRPPVSWVHIKVTPTTPLSLYDERSGKLLAQVSCYQPIVVTGTSDVRIKQDCVELFWKDSLALKELVRRAVIGGEQELSRISLKVSLCATFDIMHGLLYIPDLKLEKVINLGQVKEQKLKGKAKRAEKAESIRKKAGLDTTQNAQQQGESSNSSSSRLSQADQHFLEATQQPEGIHSLLPQPTFRPLPMSTSVGSIVGGIDITFKEPPAMNLSLPVIRFKVSLNGSNVAQGVLQGLILTSKKDQVNLSIQLTSVVVEKPLSGMAATAKGMLRGALTGTLNGLLFGQWGEGASVVGIHNIEVFDKDGCHVVWLEQVLDAFEIEKDLEAFKRLRNRAGMAAGNVREAALNLGGTIMDAVARGGSRCSIM
jgi:hypothetical protein